MQLIPGYCMKCLHYAKFSGFHASLKSLIIPLLHTKYGYFCLYLGLTCTASDPGLGSSGLGISAFSCLTCCNYIHRLSVFSIILCLLLKHHGEGREEKRGAEAKDAQSESWRWRNRRAAQGEHGDVLSKEGSKDLERRDSKHKSKYFSILVFACLSCLLSRYGNP